jgi:heterodisulfide reductase subunit C2
MSDMPLHTPSEKTHRAAELLAKVKDKVQACIQCGTCTGSCPNAFAMDHTPRHLWRLVQLEDMDNIFKSKTFTLCSACYNCSLRCPRGLELTDAMASLKQIAALQGLSQYKQSNLFYREFMESVRRHGRVREMEFMTLYFAAMKNPLVPLRFTPLGIKLMRKGKVSLEIPSRGRGALNAIFKKAEEVEAGS